MKVLSLIFMFVVSANSAALDVEQLSMEDRMNLYVSLIPHELLTKKGDEVSVHDIVIMHYAVEASGLHGAEDLNYTMIIDRGNEAKLSLYKIMLDPTTPDNYVTSAVDLLTYAFQDRETLNQLNLLRSEWINKNKQVLSFIDSRIQYISKK